MVLSNFRKILIGFFIYFYIPIVLSFANTQPSAQNVTSTVPASPKCLQSGNTNVQSALNQLDSCTGTGGGPSLWITGQGNVGIGTLANVGIGTISSINSQLVVQGNIQINGSGAGYLYSPNGLQFDPYNATGTNLNPAMFISTGDNVGIGTGNNNPQATLHVIGNTFLSNGPSFLNNALTFDANGNNFMALYTPYSVNGSAESILDFGATTGRNTLPSTPIFNIDFDKGNVGVGTIIPLNKLDVQGTVTSKAFEVTSAGNVGIGSLTPGVSLDVRGTVRALGIALPGGAQGQVIMQNAVGIGTWSTYSSSGGSSTTGTASLQGNGSGGFTNVSIGATNVIGLNSSNQIVAGSGYVSTLSPITLVSPNVGIGSISPGQVLDVQGTIRGTNIIDSGVTASTVLIANANKQISSASNLQDLAYCQSGGTNCPGSITGFANPSATIGLSANNGSATTAMRSDATPALGVTISPTWTGNHIFAPSSGSTVFSSGNVGIGSVSPGQILDIQGTVRVTGFNLNSSIVSGDVLTSDSNGNGTWQTATGVGSNYWINTTGVGIGTYANVGIGTTTPQGGLVVTNGNVGIGTWSPVASLDIKGTLPSTFGSNIGIGTTLSANALDVNGGAAVGNYAGYITTATNNLILSGNLGIGTYNTFNNTLTVNGNAVIGYNGVSGSPSNGLYVNGNTAIGTTTSVNKLEVLGALSIGTTYADTSAPTNGILVQGNIGIGTNLTGTALISVRGACSTSAQGQDTCWGTNSVGVTCLGYCTTGTFPACSTCTCC